MTTGTAWPVAHSTAASHCASWCLPHPPCCVCCGAIPVVSPTLPGPSPMTSLYPPHLMLPCASGPLRTAAASGRSLIPMAPNCSAAPSSPSTTTSLWSGSRARRAALGHQHGGDLLVHCHSPPWSDSEGNESEWGNTVLGLGWPHYGRLQGGLVRW